MRECCDLHAHSIFSDGTFTPEQLLDEAQRIGLGAVALTDHNTVAGLPDFLSAAQGRPLEAVPGVELSVDCRGTELHVLALFVEPKHFPTVTAMLEDGVRAKEESNIRLAKALENAGYSIDYPALRDATPNGQINRAHIAAELTRLGYTPDIQTAFQTLLSPKNGMYDPPKRPDVLETISFIDSLGAVSVLAHPFLDLKEEDAIRAFLQTAVPRGLCGMEIYHPKHNAKQRESALKLVKEFAIKPSGGSDFHGGNKPDIRLGVGRGDLQIPMAFLHDLKTKVNFA